MSKFRPNKDLAIPQGSIILVTGISGMIAIHIADEALKAGFRVRGTVRSREKAQAAAELLKSPDFEIVIVEDMAADGAFDEAMKNVAAVIHCASITNFSAKIEEVIPPTVKGTTNILDAALTNPSVKRVVFTSTSSAASGPRPEVKFHIGRDTWNEVSLNIVKNTPEAKRAEMGFEWAYQVYMAAKTEAERAAWGFVEEKKPPFVVNIINPSMNWGKLKGSTGVSGRQLLDILDGKIPNIPSGKSAP
jgi:nucleoside-diphosphate-sugar epimerase